MSIRVLLVDDHDIVRVGLRFVLDLEPDTEVVGEAANGRDAARMAEELRPDVVVMDIAMPGLDGVDATREIAARAPDCKVIALSMYSGSEHVERMIEAGALGYLVKDSALKELAQAVRVVAAGGSYLDSNVARMVVEGFAQHVRDRQVPERPVPTLTPREREVVRLLCEGRTVRQIASCLYVAPTTVATHRQRIMRKLGLGSLAELTKFAICERLTSVSSSPKPGDVAVSSATKAAGT